MAPHLQLSTRQKVTIARLLNRCVKLGRAALGRPMHGQFKRGGLNWQLDLNEGIDFAIYLLGAFERDLVQTYQRLIAPGATVLDIGANIGAHTLPLAKHVGPNGRVIAIEATAFAYAKLQKNLSLNPDISGRATAVQVIITSHSDAQPDQAIASSWPLNGSEETDAVLCGAQRTTQGARACTLDALLEDMQTTRVDWIKLDVDGHELPVLQGAQGCLSKYKPKIFLELAPYCYRNCPEQFQELISLLVKAGYTFFCLPDMVPLSTDERSLSKSIPKNGSINVLGLVT